MTFKTIIILYAIIVISSGQECTFMKYAVQTQKSNDDNEGDISSLSQAVQIPMKSLQDCPCFHSESRSEECQDPKYHPSDPLLPCSYLPDEFIECDLPINHRGNQTAKDELGYGCIRFGDAQRYEDVERTKVCCRALECIECRGSRTFLRDGYPCVKYTHHFFANTLLYSILLGFLGMDRFCLGKTGTAVGKLLTLGGLGLWWIVDIVLVITGSLMPQDGSNYVPTA